nr:unnamed protein product [Haemonchus contortus]
MPPSSYPFTRLTFRIVVMLLMRIGPCSELRLPTDVQPSTQEHLRSLTGDDVPSFKTSWKINPEKPCCNFFILDSRVVSEEEREIENVSFISFVDPSLLFADFFRRLRCHETKQRRRPN